MIKSFSVGFDTVAEKRRIQISLNSVSADKFCPYIQIRFNKCFRYMIILRRFHSPCVDIRYRTAIE